MAAVGGSIFSTVFFRQMIHSSTTSSSGKMKWNPVSRRFAVLREQHVSTGIAAVTETEKANSASVIDIVGSEFRRLEKERKEIQEEKQNPSVLELAEEEMKSRKSLKDYFEECKDLIKSEDGGPPRWLSPLEGGSRLDNAPLLLYLPGIDGVGLGLIRQYHSLGKLFNIRCLHIPVKDRSPFSDLVKLVEWTVRSENQNSPRRPIYLVGECLGACLALAVAALNPDIDLVLILANPGTSFKQSQLAPLIPLLSVIPDGLLLVPYIQGLMTGDSLKPVVDHVRTLLQQSFGELFQDVTAASSYLSVLSDVLTKETILWKLKLLESASKFANSHLHAVKAQTLILSSGSDMWLPSQEEGSRLHNIIPKCEIRYYHTNGHFLFLEDEFDFGSVIKVTLFYRRGAHYDFISDFVPPSPIEFKKIYESIRCIRDILSPVMLSTLEDGKIVRGLAGIPSEGPVLFLGYHMLFGFDLYPMVTQIFLERDILLRGIAHPFMFMGSKEESLIPQSQYDNVKQMGAVPVSASLLFKLLSSKAHVLLYPGGLREVCHRKGEEYKLFWPEQSEFVRMAARFGAKIVPIGVVGADDVCDVVFDYDDQMKIPILRDYIKMWAEETTNVRAEAGGAVGNQDRYIPGVVPKLPGRLYHYFGKPIETEGRKMELRNRDKAQELYLQVKSEVEKCIGFLKEKRESDPYRNILARMAYQALHGTTAEIPTFEL